MWKRLLCAVMPLVMLLQLVSIPARGEEQAQSGMQAFSEPSQGANPFTDVPAGSGFYPGVTALYHLGLMGGVTESTFAPGDAMTAAQFISLAVRIYERYYGIQTDFTAPEGKPWYTVYITKAMAYGFLPVNFSAYHEPVSRRLASHILYQTLPVRELARIRAVPCIPGISTADPYYGEILALYEAGVINGIDQYGTFYTGKPLTRGETAALFYRLICPQARIAMELQPVTGMRAFQIPSSEIALPFFDVVPSAWYADSVHKLYACGLLGTSSGSSAFLPNRPISLAEAAALAVRLYNKYHGLESYGNDPVWPDGYVALAKQYNLADSGWTDYSAPATRAQVAHLAYHCLPQEELTARNSISALPDLNASHNYYQEILALYQAGIVGGTDSYGAFSPGHTITKAEACALFERLIVPEKRLSLFFKRDLRALERKISETVATYPGKWSVYVCDVATDSEFVVNPQRMWSASVVKLYVMAAVLEALEDGTLTDSPGIQNNLKDMITWSSNTAWSNLTAALGYGSYSAGSEKILQFCAANGYPDSGRHSSTAPYNTTSAADTGLFLKRVVKGTNVSPEASRKMLELLKAQAKTTKIPAGVPKGIVTANKTGELFGAVPVQNDAAIVYAPNGTYILVVLTQGGSVSKIKALSSMVYQELSK